MKSLKAEKCKPCEIYRRVCSVYVEACFNQKIFTNWQNMDLPRQALVEKTIHGVEAHRLSSKENFLGAVVSENGNSDNIQGHTRTHPY